MRRQLICWILLIVFEGLAFSRIAHAGVKGACSNCHTMHNSQNSQPVVYKLTNDATAIMRNIDQPNPQLLISDCIGCHSSDNADTIDSKNKPIVYNIVPPNKTLAGGNFYYAKKTESTMGHNVAGITEADPVFKYGYIPGTGSNRMYFQVACAGAQGCHGDRIQTDPYSAIKGSHHSNLNGAITDGSTPGKSYRFLLGTHGFEEDKWEQNNSAAQHNEYKGSFNPTDSSTISSFCAKCHDGFHVSNNQNQWIKHPTDILLPNKGKYKDYNNGTCQYTLLAPVARSNIPSSTPNYVHPTSNPGIVMCLSCHRAHGSPFFKMLRWDYRDTNNNYYDGCAVCHGDK